jgi:hypothetical protein
MRPWLPLAFAAACLAQPAAAFDLTGTWEGKQVCRGLSAGEKTSFSIPSQLRITQTGTELALEVVSDAGTDVYNGIGIDNALKPTVGEAYFVHCGMSDVPAVGDAFDESGRALLRTNEETGGGSFTGSSSFYNDLPEVFTCKWIYKRTDPADPGVSGCPS